MSYFEQKLWELLPDLYRESDETGDLAAFLAIVAPILDELKGLADRLPSIFDVADGPEKYLPLLATVVGQSFDPAIDTRAMRRNIREAVESYRRKGTLPAIHRSLERIGWKGRLDETFRKAMRLNRRSILSRARLPGRIYTLGAYRVESEEITHGIHEALAFHHPAGTRAFFLQWLKCLLDLENPEHHLTKCVAKLTTLRLGEAVVLNRNRLNRDRHLTRKKKTAALVSVTQGHRLDPELSGAWICINRWQARSPGFPLNHAGLNRERRMPNLWVSAKRLSILCETETRTDGSSPNRPDPLNGINLNRVGLPKSGLGCQVKFRQIDGLSLLDLAKPSPAGSIKTIRLASRVRTTNDFRLGISALGRGHRLFRTAAIPTLSYRWLVSDASASIERSHDLVDRWLKSRPGYGLNRNRLNGTALTDGYVNQGRVSLEIEIDTGHPGIDRNLPVTLNRKKLNRAGLRLSVRRNQPMRLNRMPLNAAGPRISKPGLTWHFKQEDVNGSAQATLTAAVNRFRVTRWPG